MLNKGYRELLHYLLIDLICCWQRPQSELLRLEAAYLITKKHYDDLMHTLGRYEFIDDAEEIDFFKNIHPQFAGRIRYYSLLYEKLTHYPARPGDAAIFWKRDKRRLDRFRRKHESFVSYLQNGNSCKDDVYFLRRNNGVFIPGNDPGSDWFAEKCYHQYILSLHHSLMLPDAFLMMVLLTTEFGAYSMISTMM